MRLNLMSRHVALSSRCVVQLKTSLPKCLQHDHLQDRVPRS